MSHPLLQWKTPTPRAKPIPIEEWEKHQDELLDLYGRMTLQDMMAVMKIRHCFCPTRRQYITQLQKWQAHKYAKRGWDTAFDGLGPAAISAQTQSMLFDDNFADITQFSGSKSSSRATSSTEGIRQRPVVPPKKRKKLDKFMMEKSQTNRRQDPGPELVFATLIPENHVDFIAMEETGEEKDAFHAIGGEALGQEQAPLLPHSTQPYCLPSTSDTSSPTNFSPDTASMTSVPSPVSSQSDECDVDGLLVLDVSAPVDTLTNKQVIDIKLAADFLFSTHCYSDSFGLYALIIKHMMSHIELPTFMKTSAILNCVRSSATSAQITVAQNLLEQALSERPIYAVDTAETFLYRSLLANLGQRAGDSNTARYHKSIADRSSFEENRSLSALSSQDRSFDMVTFQYLHHNLKSRGHFRDARHLRKELLTRVPGPFECNDNHLAKPLLRSCLRWFQSIANPHLITGYWQNLKSRETIHKKQTAFIATFCEIWQRLQRISARSLASCTMSWIHDVEPKMGISLTEFIAVFCLMVLNAAPNVEFPVFIQNIMIQPQDVDRISDQVSEGCTVLSKLDDMQLAESFLDSYNGLGLMFRPESEADRSHTSLIQDYTRAFLQDSLQIVLPEKAEDVGDASVQQDLFSSPPTNLINSIPSPTLASSLHSSELDSLRSLRARIEDVGEALESISLELPSKAIWDESRSSMGLFPNSFLESASRNSSAALLYFENTVV